MSSANTYIGNPLGTTEFGHCEFCDKWSSWLNLHMPDSSTASLAVTDLDENWYRSPLFVCGGCSKGRWPKFVKVIVKRKFDKMDIVEAARTDEELEVLEHFLNVKSKMGHLISDIFFLPEGCRPKQYENDLNVVINIARVSTLRYLEWARNNRGWCLLHLWRGKDNQSRTKFFSAKITRLLIALGSIQHNTKGLNIFIYSHGRLHHIDAFVKPLSPSSKVLWTPRSMWRLNK